MKIVMALAVGVFTLAPVAGAGEIHYTDSQLSLAGAVYYEGFLGAPSLSDSYSSYWNDTTPPTLNESFSIAVYPYGPESSSNGMRGHVISSAGPGGFSIEIQAQSVVRGDFASGSDIDHHGDASARVNFSVLTPTLVDFSLAGDLYTTFERVDVPELIAIETTGTVWNPLTGRVLLEPGDYTIYGGHLFGTSGSKLEGGSTAIFSLQVVPAPGAAALLTLGAGLGAIRRRRAA